MEILFLVGNIPYFYQLSYDVDLFVGIILNELVVVNRRLIVETGGTPLLLALFRRVVRSGDRMPGLAAQFFLFFLGQPGILRGEFSGILIEYIGSEHDPSVFGLDIGVVGTAYLFFSSCLRCIGF